MANTEK